MVRNERGAGGAYCRAWHLDYRLLLESPYTWIVVRCNTQLAMIGGSGP